MFRKLTFGAIAAIGLTFGTQEATAGEPGFGPVSGPAGCRFHPPRVDYDYVVFYRRGPHCHWERYGRFETMHAARHVERRLEREGFQVFIQQVRDRRW